MAFSPFESKDGYYDFFYEFPNDIFTHTGFLRIFLYHYDLPDKPISVTLLRDLISRELRGTRNFEIIDKYSTILPRESSQLVPIGLYFLANHGAVLVGPPRSPIVTVWRKDRRKNFMKEIRRLIEGKPNLYMGSFRVTGVTTDDGTEITDWPPELDDKSDSVIILRYTATLVEPPRLKAPLPREPPAPVAPVAPAPLAPPAPVAYLGGTRRRTRRTRKQKSKSRSRSRSARRRPRRRGLHL